MVLAAPVLISDSCWDRYPLRADSISAVAGFPDEPGQARFSSLSWLSEHVGTRGITDRKPARTLKEQSSPFGPRSSWAPPSPRERSDDGRVRVADGGSV